MSTINYQLSTINCQLPREVSFANGLPLVIAVFTLAECYLHLRQSVLVDVQTQRDDGLAALLCLSLEFAKFFSRQQQFSISPYLVVLVRTEAVLRDMHLLHVQLIPYELTIRLIERSLALPDTLDLRAVQLYARHVPIQYQVVKTRPSVFDIYIACQPCHVSLYTQKSCKVTAFF